MRAELERIKKIEDYLMNNLSESDKLDFEKQIKSDTVLAHEVEHQRILIDRVRILTLKKSIKNAHKRYTNKSNGWFNRNWFIIVGLLILIVAIVITIIKREPSIEQFHVENQFINPPIPSADVPFEEYSVKSDQLNVISYSSGSKISIPANAFLDENGNVFKGEVQIQYREFNDPIDFYLAGIPMNIDLNGKTYTLESAAMCDINATGDGKKLKINPENPITIFQSSYTSSNSFDLYYLDTIAKSWKKKGKDVPINTNEFTLDILPEKTSQMLSDDFVQPIEPRKANPERYSFTISLDQKEFPEMEGFKNIVFEIDEDEKRYNPSDADVLWEDIHLQKGKKQGTYQITFMKKTVLRSAQYIARPVFEGADYDEAMKLYNQKIEKYNRVKRARYSKENSERIAILEQNRLIDSLNAVIESRNQEILAENSIIDSLNDITKIRNKEILNEQAQRQIQYNRNIKPEPKAVLNAELNYKRVSLVQYELVPTKQFEMIANAAKQDLYKYENTINEAFSKHQTYIELKDKTARIIKSPLIPQETKDKLASYSRKELEANKEEINRQIESLNMGSFSYNRVRNRVIRQFEIDGFGVWNCDVIYQMRQRVNPIKAEFYDMYAGMYLTEVVFINKKRNSLVRYNRQMFPFFDFDRESENLLWAVAGDNRIMYFNNFKSVPDTTEFTFNMKTLEGRKGEYTDYWQFRAKLKSLMY